MTKERSTQKAFSKQERENMEKAINSWDCAVPDQRKIAKKYRELPLPQVEQLLHSEYHEERLTALLILTYKYEKANLEEQKAIYQFYMDNLDHINNWDLVDSSAPKIAGPFLEHRDRTALYELANSDDLWRRRVAMITCLHFIRNKDFEDALSIAEILRNDEHDLIHKAVGWMLREIGQLDMETEEHFLVKHYEKIPRTHATDMQLKNFLKKRDRHI
ncbi:MAG: DNA alkylation repair protein [Balneolaceae bacterium]|nr:DNA alkylation repair protein [Balneolaceae bacterium]